jgi:Uma2 family endonuclease
MELPKEKTPQPTRSKTRKVPSALIYEIMDGEPIYYKGYTEVLKGKKTVEEIMGSSTLQSLLVFYINQILIKGLDLDKYFIFTAETGIHINHKDNFANDIALYESSVLTPDKINTNYADVPPRLAIEIDTKADLANTKHQEYVNRKTQKLLDFGVEKVIWIFSETQKVMTATQIENWQIMPWNKDVALIEGLSFNISQYLTKKGIETEKNI